MKLIVTGGAGFLGSHLSLKLLTLGHEVLGIDNFYTGHRRNLQTLLDFENYNFIEHDVTEPYYQDCDGIFNLACPASPVQYQRNPIFTLRTNFLGSYHALELARQRNCRVLQASTSEVYGDPLVNPQKENYFGNVNPNGIRACYDEGKRVSETLFMDYNRTYGTDTRIIRIFNTYGPLMDKNDGRVVSSFIMQALQNKDISVYGDGTQTRSFCYVTDLIDGMTRLFFDSNLNGPVNIGNPNPVSMLKLAQEIIEYTESSSQITYQPFPADDPKLRDPDISIAKSALMWEPKVSREEGLKKTIGYFDKFI